MKIDINKIDLDDLDELPQKEKIKKKPKTSEPEAGTKNVKKEK